jgi:predicted GH43/DUF377 family glycosyl hydrolase
MSIQIRHSKAPILEPRKDVPWAETMVTNPAIIKDPISNRLHLLFRACGPWPEYTPKGGKYPPYLWVLGYASSDDMGETWDIDWSKPAMMPAMNMTSETIWTTNINGKRVVDYANAYIEDPRLFTLEGETYLTVCTRMFPVGPYWLNPTGKEPWAREYLPEWARKPDNPFGLGVKYAGNILYQVNMEHLRKRDYEKAFTVIHHLTDPEKGDNRDVFFFPEKFTVHGKKQYLLMHRPVTPQTYPEIAKGETRPSMFLSLAENFEDFPTPRAEQHFLATSIFDWELNKVGGSTPPIRVSKDEWLVSYHGRHKEMGYTQSFMILKEMADDFPVITNRCPERLLYATMDWEQPKNFPLPCLFSCGGVVVDDTLIISYGAADELAGIAKVNLNELTEYIRRFDATGNIRS